MKLKFSSPPHVPPFSSSISNLNILGGSKRISENGMNKLQHSSSYHMDRLNSNDKINNNSSNNCNIRSPSTSNTFERISENPGLDKNQNPKHQNFQNQNFQNQNHNQRLVQVVNSNNANQSKPRKSLPGTSSANIKNEKDYSSHDDYNSCSGSNVQNFSHTSGPSSSQVSSSNTTKNISNSIPNLKNYNNTNNSNSTMHDESSIEETQKLKEQTSGNNNNQVILRRTWRKENPSNALPQNVTQPLNHVSINHPNSITNLTHSNNTTPINSAINLTRKNSNNAINQNAVASAANNSQVQFPPNTIVGRSNQGQSQVNHDNGNSIRANSTNDMSFGKVGKVLETSFDNLVDGSGQNVKGSFFGAV